MSIVILVGGADENGNAEHRYLVGQFLQRFDQEVCRIITARPAKTSLARRLTRMVRRRNYSERLARALYPGGYGPAAADIKDLLMPDERRPCMPGGERICVVSSHNSAACRALVQAARPRIIVVYGTAIIRTPVFSLASDITLNMHTGLSPWYRGDSTLFWPVYFNEPDRLGVTVHELVESVDGGDIAATAPVAYEPGDTEAHLFAKGVRTGTSLYLDVVEQALAGNLACTPQDLSLGREFSWRDRTVSAERQVLARLDEWATLSGSRAA